MPWNKLQVILKEIAPTGHFALAYSGGVDSRFAAHAAQKMGFAPLLLHVQGPHIPQSESAYARRWAAARGLSLRELVVSPMDLPAVAAGTRERCYACKHRLFSRLRDVADGLPLCDGTHASDTQGYRPGRKALKELNIYSPLALARLSKADIRQLGRMTGLDDPDQSARPCLLTRLNYGLAPSPELLTMIANGEQAAADVLRTAFGERTPDFRLRLTAPDRWELHLRSRDDTREVPPSVQHDLTQALRKRAHVPVACIAVMDTLSGYFDQKNYADPQGRRI
ncbi:MAG: tRNA(Ile)-lysidine synthetase [Desulfovibrionaceae bacterium]|nr:tRNA(Ile)-lysidine synthetase [Desulfovibrionaceae bacterium]